MANLSDKIAPSGVPTLDANNSFTGDNVWAGDTALQGPVIRSRQALGNQSTAFSWNWNSGGAGFTFTATGDTTINAPSNPPTLTSDEFVDILFTIIQDATGGRTPTWNAIFKNAPPLGESANDVNTIAAVYDGTNYILGSVVTT